MLTTVVLMQRAEPLPPLLCRDRTRFLLPQVWRIAWRVTVLTYNVRPRFRACSTATFRSRSPVARYFQWRRHSPKPEPRHWYVVSRQTSSWSGCPREFRYVAVFSRRASQRNIAQAVKVLRETGFRLNLGCPDQIPGMHQFFAILEAAGEHHAVREREAR